MSGIGSSLFTGIPVEFSVPNSTKVIFVNDFFIKDMQGGAELTSEALIKKSPHGKVFKLHSGSVTPKLINANKDKYWIFGNFAGMQPDIFPYIRFSNLKYSIIEYDFKFCIYRSINRHQQQTNGSCNCKSSGHGLEMAQFFDGAQNIFWMSEDQKNIWISNIPAISDHKGHMILSSVFDDDSLKIFKRLRENTKTRSTKWAILGSGSWIKGIEETQKWCKLNKKEFEPIPGMPYEQFLSKLNSYQGFIFMPLDSDTYPRVTIEAKLLGLNLIMNVNVLQKNDPWFSGSVEDCENYMKNRTKVFWDKISF